MPLPNGLSQPKLCLLDFIILDIQFLLSSFTVFHFKVCFVISFKLLNKFSIDEIGYNIPWVYVVINHTSFDQHKLLKLIYQLRLLLFLKDTKSNDRPIFREYQSVYVMFE